MLLSCSPQHARFVVCGDFGCPDFGEEPMTFLGMTIVTWDLEDQRLSSVHKPGLTHDYPLKTGSAATRCSGAGFNVYFYI